jgi:hypothetical protein
MPIGNIHLLRDEFSEFHGDLSGDLQSPFVQPMTSTTSSPELLDESRREVRYRWNDWKVSNTHTATSILLFSGAAPVVVEAGFCSVGSSFPAFVR